MNLIQQPLRTPTGESLRFSRSVQIALVLICACLMTAGCALTSWQLPRTDEESNGGTAASLLCTTPAPTNASEVANLFTTADPRVFAGGDGILAARLGSGRTLVITADNFTDPSGGQLPPTIGPGTAMRHNAAFLTQDGCLRAASTGELLPTVYADPAGAPRYFWPSALITHDDTTFTLFADVMTTSASSALNSFDFHRVGVARYTIRVIGSTVIAEREADLPGDPAGISWSAGGGRDSAGRAVIFGSRAEATAWEIFAARTDDPLSDPSTWEYSTVSGWQIGGTPAPVAGNCSDAVGPLPGDPYRFATKLGGAIGTDVALLRVDPPTGRVVMSAVVAQVPSTTEMWSYNPQFFPVSDRQSALLINHNSMSAETHDRAAFSPAAIMDVMHDDPIWR